MTTPAEQWHNEQKRMAATAAAWPNRDDDYHSYPILVTETIEHVIWVEATSARQALHYASSDTYEYIAPGKQTCASADLEVKAPQGRWDWDMVYSDSYNSYPGLRCDAHVETWRRWRWELNRLHGQAVADNEDLDGVGNDVRLTCRLCRTWREEGHDGGFPHLHEVRAAELKSAEVAS